MHSAWLLSNKAGPLLFDIIFIITGHCFVFSETINVNLLHSDDALENGSNFVSLETVCYDRKCI